MSETTTLSPNPRTNSTPKSFLVGIAVNAANEASSSIEAIVRREDYLNLPSGSQLRTLFGSDLSRALIMLKNQNSNSELNQNACAGYAASNLTRTINALAQAETLTWPQRHLLRKVRNLFVREASNLPELRNNLSVAIYNGEKVYAELRRTNISILKDHRSFYLDHLDLLKSLESFARASDETATCLVDSNTSLFVDLYVTKKNAYCLAAMLGVAALRALTAPRQP